MSKCKSSAAVPLAAPVTAASVAPATSGSDQRYRPKGRPQGEEIEYSDSDEEHPDDTIQVSVSLAHQKLAALADPNRRRSSQQQTQRQPPAAGGPGPSLLSQQLPQAQRPRPPHTQSQPQAPTPHARPQLSTVASAPIPLHHPYNLPLPEPPTTPRTTRRQMLSTELSESLRRQVLWERQVGRGNAGAQRRSFGGGVRPLTTVEGFRGQQQGQPSGQQQQQGQGAAEDPEERRKRALARNRSWADEYHYSGW
ncbi:uncharacterized protein BXZ73DRAFT_58645 [Epithele typhae]|uniref:uncharacterized protein n=1 Tax=Epithele typhae TaxID=378194 RepID=UPI0020076FB5|nr:uncharacterized protein BXZ73DRAFT_58645 [Epithele typhae]KAH9910328.1 hypothetical protein BXZ73DRAFT_58645 [Epithele typhae]